MSQNAALAAISQYWDIYGGFKALLSSVYFWASLAFTIFCTNYALQQAWYDIAISVLPLYFGFSLTAYGLILSVGGSDIIQVLSTKDDDQIHSDYQTFSSTFFHFLFVQ